MAETNSGTSSPIGLQQLEQVLKHFDPAQLLFKISYKDKDRTLNYHMVETQGIVRVDTNTALMKMQKRTETMEMM